MSADAIAAVNIENMKKEIAKVAAKYFAPYRESILRSYLAGLADNEIGTELTAFNADTKNGTRLVIISPKIDENGNVLDNDGEIMQNAVAMGTVEGCNGAKLVFGVPYVADTAQRNNRIIAYWLAYRQNIDGNFISARVRMFEELNKQLEKVEAKENVFVSYGMPIPGQLKEERQTIEEKLAKFGVK